MEKALQFPSMEIINFKPQNQTESHHAQPKNLESLMFTNFIILSLELNL